MGFNITIAFKGKKHIEIESLGREHYKITVLLTVEGDGTKLSPMVILKGEPGKTIEKNMRNLSFTKNKKMLGGLMNYLLNG